MFVGRSQELELLERAYRETVDAQKPRLVTLLGDAGVGKTRLARELWEWLASQSPEPIRRVGRCLAYGRGITYWPFAEVLKEHLGVLDSDSAQSILHRLKGREILGLTLGLDAASDLHPLVARDRLHDAWVDFLQVLAAERPVVLLIEDLHWAEEPLLDLIERIAADPAGAILLDHSSSRVPRAPGRIWGQRHPLHGAHARAAPAGARRRDARRADRCTFAGGVFGTASLHGLRATHSSLRSSSGR